MLHGDYDIGVFEHETLHFFVVRIALFAEVFASLGCKGRCLCRHIEHPCGDRIAVASLSVAHEREKIYKHLHIESVEHIGNFKWLARRLVIYDSDIRLSVYLCEIDSVHLAGNIDVSAGGYFQIIRLYRAVMRYIKFEIDRAEFAVFELVRKPRRDRIYAAREAFIEIEKPFRPLRAVKEALEIRVQISAYFFIAFIGIELGELLCAEFAEQMFEHEMYDRAFL